MATHRRCIILGSPTDLRHIVSMITFHSYKKYICWLGCSLAFIACLEQAYSQEPSSIQITPRGTTVELNLNTPLEGEYILESQAKIMEGEEWEPLMRFRGQTAKPKNWTDPMCGSGDARFFRLKKLLESPQPQVSNFRLIDLHGHDHELYYHWPEKAIILFLTGKNLEHAVDHRETLESLSTEFGVANLKTWVVSVSDVVERDTLRSLTEDFGENLPILQDPSQSVTRTLSSGKLPEVVLIDPKDWSIHYQGSLKIEIDTGTSMVVEEPLRDALGSLLEGRQADISQMAVFGDGNRPDPINPASFSEHIAPLLQNHCFPCHTEGNIAPWAMTSHSVIEEFSGLIKSAVLAGEMPPWHADPKYSHFSNSKSMTDDEIAMLIDWIDRGSPRGEGPDPLAEEPAPETVDWPMGEPDAIISIPLQSIPANGVIDYKYLVAQSPFPSDVWLRAVHVKPGDRSVVHHCLVFKGSFSELLALRGGLAGFFAGYVPGMEQTEFPEGTGKLLKRADNIVFQMHYTVSGKATTDQTQLGLYLSDEKPDRELITSAAFDTSFTIPPNSKDVYVSASTTFTGDALLYEFSPHMHYRGSSARYTLIYPNETRETILNVPAYFFDWQALYRLEEPISIPRGTVLLCEGTFDNSVQNRFNPDPNTTVQFGEQSWEEMFIGYFNYSLK